MKKKLLLEVFMLISFLSTQAQSIFSDDFGTDQTAVTASLQQWKLKPGLNHAAEQSSWLFRTSSSIISSRGFAGNVATSNSYADFGGSGNDDIIVRGLQNLLISPEFDLTNVAAANLKYKIATFDTALAQGLRDFPPAVMNYKVFIVLSNETEITVDNLGTPLKEDSLAAGSAIDVTVNLRTADLGHKVRLVFLHDKQTVGKGTLILDDIVVARQDMAGISENLISKLFVFPNPVNDVVNINSNENILLNGAEIVDINGRKVKIAKFNSVTNAQINISDLASGVYMMTLFSDKGSVVKKIVKK